MDKLIIADLTALRERIQHRVDCHDLNHDYAAWVRDELDAIIRKAREEANKSRFMLDTYVCINGQLVPLTPLPSRPDSGLREAAEEVSAAWFDGRKDGEPVRDPARLDKAMDALNDALALRYGAEPGGVSLDAVIAWLKGRPGASWQATVKDIEQARAALAQKESKT